MKQLEVFACEWIFIALPQETDIRRVVQRIQRYWVGLMKLVVQANGTHILSRTMCCLHLAVTLQLLHYTWSSDSKRQQDQKDRHHQPHKQVAFFSRTILLCTLHRNHLISRQWKPLRVAVLKIGHLD